MKNTLNLLFLSLLFFCSSCGDDPKSESSAANQTQTTTEELTPRNIQEKSAALETEKAEPVAVLNGKYRKYIKDKPAEDCNCNCIEVDFDRPSEWCIVKDKMYISAQSKKSGENSVDLYFVKMSREESPDRPMPWKDFDINKPIASITFKPNGDAELDWKGFSINGEIATDYAILGKKTLEGTYKKD